MQKAMREKWSGWRWERRVGEWRIDREKSGRRQRERSREAEKKERERERESRKSRIEKEKGV